MINLLRGSSETTYPLLGEDTAEFYCIAFYSTGENTPNLYVLGVNHKIGGLMQYSVKMQMELWFIPAG